MKISFLNLNSSNMYSKLEFMKIGISLIKDNVSNVFCKSGLTLAGVILDCRPQPRQQIDVSDDL